MKKSTALIVAFLLGLALLSTCGKDSPNNSGPVNTDTTAVMDLTVVGDWEGKMANISAIKFNGAEIFVDIAKPDSVFSLVTLDPSKDTAINPAIKDTSLVLTGTWSLNAASDSILLHCDTGRIIDTALNILSPREVRGQMIPMFINISKNASTNDIEWEIAMTDLVPLAPMLGIDLSKFPSSLLQVLKNILTKKKQ